MKLKMELMLENIYSVLIAVSATAFGIYILIIQQAVLLSPRTGQFDYIYYPGYIFIALSCFSFAACFLVHTWNRKFKSLPQILFILAIILFSVGFIMGSEA